MTVFAHKHFQQMEKAGGSAGMLVIQAEMDIASSFIQADVKDRGQKHALDAVCTQLNLLSIGLTNKLIVPLSILIKQGSSLVWMCHCTARYTGKQKWSNRVRSLLLNRPLLYL